MARASKHIHTHTHTNTLRSARKVSLQFTHFCPPTLARSRPLAYRLDQIQSATERVSLASKNSNAESAPKAATGAEPTSRRLNNAKGEQCFRALRGRMRTWQRRRRARARSLARTQLVATLASRVNGAAHWGPSLTRRRPHSPGAGRTRPRVKLNGRGRPAAGRWRSPKPALDK